MRFAVFGSQKAARNSLSPRMMSNAFSALGIDAEYIAVGFDSHSEANVAMLNLAEEGFSGCNVTTPFKAVAADVALHKSERVAKMGVANVLSVLANGDLYADATDGIALLEAVQARNINLPDSAVLIIGAGGCATEVAFACAEVGVTSISIVNRTLQKAELLASKLHNFYPAIELQVFDQLPIRNEAYTVISCTPAYSMYADTIAKIGDSSLFVDYAYQLSGQMTPMMVAADNRGALCIDGRELLVRQAAAALRVWFDDVLPPIEVMLRATR